MEKRVIDGEEGGRRIKRNTNIKMEGQCKEIYQEKAGVNNKEWEKMADVREMETSRQ